MPRSIDARRLPVNLLQLHGAATQRLRLNLGVEGAYTPPPDPAEVVGLLTLSAGCPWDAFEQKRGGGAVQWGGAASALRPSEVKWGGDRLLHRGARVDWGGLATVIAARRATWMYGSAVVAVAFASPWRQPVRLGSGVGAAWSASHAGAARAVFTPWSSPPRAGTHLEDRWGIGRSAAATIGSIWNSPPQVILAWRIPWGYGNGLEWVVRPPGGKPEPPKPRPVDGRFVGLNLGCGVFDGPRSRLPLNLGVATCWGGRPQRRTYVVLNEVSVVRLPDRLPIAVDSLSIAGSRDQWCWDLTLRLLREDQLDALRPTSLGPRKVEVTVNGYVWVFAIESFDRSRGWSSIGVSVAGRSVAAQLAEPYALARGRAVAETRTMHQLADAEVAGSEITVDYGTVDWLVDGGAWYYDGLTPMSALVRLAGAAGAVVQSDPREPVVRIVPKYPISPWAWTTSPTGATLADDVVWGERLQLQSRPVYDAVIVAGERVGVAAKVRRSGEAGQTFASQQIDQLITHYDGARERGRNVLCDRGGQANIENELPLFPAPLQVGQPGLILPLTLVQRVTAAESWVGLATGVRIEVSRQDAALDVVQTVSIARHYTDAN